MSSVGEPFLHDIFVTYSIGEAGGPEAQRLAPWYRGFIKELDAELRLQPKFGRDLSLLVDDPDQPVPLDDLGRAAVFVVLMSPQYLQSRPCSREREQWVQSQRDLGVATDGRIAVARVMPTDEGWPEPLIDERGHPLVGFRFFDPQRAEFDPRPFAWPAPTPESRDPFRGVLLDLVGQLWFSLSQLRQRLERPASSRLAVAGEQAGLARTDLGRGPHEPGRGEPSKTAQASAAAGRSRPRENRAADVFLSYAREDKNRARLFATAFEAIGWSVFWDPLILPGSSWDTVLENEIRLCKCVVVLWSAESVRSTWVRNECSVALARGILVPVALDEAATPMQYLHLQSAQLQQWDGNAEDERFSNLVRGIELLAPRRPARSL